MRRKAYPVTQGRLALLGIDQVSRAIIDTRLVKNIADGCGFGKTENSAEKV